jgi:uncharacterized protein DUF4157
VDNAPRVHTPTIRAANTGLMLRRKCACGTHTAGGNTCNACKQEKLQRKATTGARSNAVPPSVHDVLATPGAVLAPSVRATMERGFGHDFSQVRVHNDAAAARSAAAVDAAAYTVGSHVVFGAGSFAPDTRAGRHLIAHELAHVVQQNSGGLMRKSLSSLLVGSEHDPAERDADQAADRVVAGDQASPALSAPLSMQRAPRRAPAIVGLDEAGPDANLTGDTDARLATCLRGSAGMPAECPKGLLTIADFQEARSVGGGFAAVTGSDVAPTAMDPQAATCMRTILGWTPDQTHIFQGLFVPRSSRMIRSAVRANDPDENGCARIGRQCDRNFTRRMPRGRVAGAFTMASDARACPASAAAPITAATQGGCPALVATCTANAVIDQARLLAHEQGHLDIACKIAGRINHAIRAGTPLSTFPQNAVRRAVALVQRQYDAQTRHGCIAAAQARWLADIANGLPHAVIPTRRQAPRSRAALRPRGRAGQAPPGTGMRL